MTAANGALRLPADGHEICPAVAIRRLPNGPGPSSARLASAHPNAPRRPEML